MSKLVLPMSVMTKADVSHLATELLEIDGQLTANALRKKKGMKKVEKPILSDELEDFLDANDLAIDNGIQRADTIKQLSALKQTLPVLHMTFSVAADRESLAQLIAWLRESIHPQAVVHVGVQPSLIAGVYLRTPNHVYDLSLRKSFTSNHDVIVKDLEQLRVDA